MGIKEAGETSPRLSLSLCRVSADGCYSSIGNFN